MTRLPAALIMALLCQTGLAATPQPPAASTTPVNAPPAAARYVEPCACSSGQPLTATQALVFNCECGAMKCVVTAVAANNAKDSPAPSLVCR